MPEVERSGARMVDRKLWGVGLVVLAGVLAPGLAGAQSLTQLCAGVRGTVEAPGYVPSPAVLRGLGAPALPQVIEDAPDYGSLLARVPRGDPQRAGLLLRAAVQAQAQAGVVAGAAAGSLRAQAIGYLEELVQGRPDFAQRDEALYRLGLLRSDQGDAAGSRRAFLDLIRNYPQSRYLPWAYLTFAERYYADRQPEEARQFLERVLQFPDTELAGLARYRLAWCRRQLQDVPGALQDFLLLARWAAAHAADPEARRLLEAARQEFCPLIPGRR
jgi:tetratricopeptide (TPR) repeat protein